MYQLEIRPNEGLSNALNLGEIIAAWASSYPNVDAFAILSVDNTKNAVIVAVNAEFLEMFTTDVLRVASIVDQMRVW
jgi:hypothetical protein